MSQTADLQNDNDSIRQKMMLSSELDTLMLLYARRGIDDWNKAGGKKMRRRASQCIGVDVADNERDAKQTIRTDLPENSSCAGHSKFIPMPKFNTKGIERCFFSPVARRTKDGLNLSSICLYCRPNGLSRISLRAFPWTEFTAWLPSRATQP